MIGKLGVVVLAAGKSTRFKSNKTKVLHKLCGKPMIEWVLDATLPLKPEQFVIVYGTHSEALKDYYASGYQNHHVDFALQEPTLGTAHALMQAKDKLRDDITHLLVLPGDAPLLESKHLLPLADAFTPEIEHTVLTVDVDQPGDLGRVIRPADSDVISEIVEAHDASDEQKKIKEISTGIYIFSRDVFDHLDTAKERFGASESKGEYYLPDAVKIAKTAGVKVGSFPIPVGVNDRIQLDQAEKQLLKRIQQYWMSEGVTFHLPETTYLDHSIKLSKDVEIGPHCVLTGETSIGEGTVLVQGCLLEDCKVGSDCELRHVRGQEAQVDNNVTAGPYVNLRPHTVIHDDVKIGNFVEIKKAEIGKGSKLPHLQYIGDATLGEKCNIGAGTIFCNYDGIRKLHTTLGDGVFIGSNSALQGGVNIEAGAYVAMASAITRDIPAGALAIARAHQENKLDYVEKLKDRLQRRKEKQEQEKAQQDSAAGE